MAKLDQICEVMNIGEMDYILFGIPPAQVIPTDNQLGQMIISRASLVLFRVQQDACQYRPIVFVLLAENLELERILFVHFLAFNLHSHLDLNTLLADIVIALRAPHEAFIKLIHTEPIL